MRESYSDGIGKQWREQSRQWEKNKLRNAIWYMKYKKLKKKLKKQEKRITALEKKLK